MMTMILILKLFGIVFLAREVQKIFKPLHKMHPAVGCIFSLWYLLWTLLAAIFLNGPLPKVYFVYGFAITMPLAIAFIVHGAANDLKAADVEKTPAWKVFARLDALVSAAMLTAILLLA